MDNLKDQVERGITTAYRKTIWRYFVCAVKEYQLIQPGDRVAVCVISEPAALTRASSSFSIHISFCQKR